MNLETVIKFLERVYEYPEGKNLTRLEQEAIGEAVRRLRQIWEHDKTNPESVHEKSDLRLLERK